MISALVRDIIIGCSVVQLMNGHLGYIDDKVYLVSAVKLLV